MAKPWAEVAKSDGYRALSSAEREEARNEYWREVVAPRVPVAELMGVRQAFDADTAPGLVAQIKRQLSPPSPPAAANDASVVPQPAPEAYVPSNAPGSIDAYPERDLPPDSAAFEVAPRMAAKRPRRYCLLQTCQQSSQSSSRQRRALSPVAPLGSAGTLRWRAFCHPSTGRGVMGSEIERLP